MKCSINARYLYIGGYYGYNYRIIYNDFCITINK